MTTPTTPTPAAPAANPAVPFSWEAVAQEFIGVFVAASKAVFLDAAPALISAAILIVPFLHSGTRPHAKQFLGWLHANGVDTVELLQDVYGYTVTSTVKRWLIAALLANPAGFVAQGFTTWITEGHVTFGAIFRFGMVLGIIQGVFFIAYLTVSTANGRPTKRETELAVQGTDGDWNKYLKKYGKLTSPLLGLVVLFMGATFVGMAHAYYVTSAVETTIAARVFGVMVGLLSMLGCGLAFQVIATFVTEIGLSTLFAMAKPVSGIVRTGVVFAVPGLTKENRDAILGPALELKGAAEKVTIALFVGAVGVAHLGLALGVSAPWLLIGTGVMLAWGCGLYIGHALRSEKTGETSGIVFTVLFLGMAFWVGYVEPFRVAMAPLGGKGALLFIAALLATLIAAAVVAMIFSVVVGIFTASHATTYPKIDHWASIGSAALGAGLVLLLAFPLVTGAMKSSYAPTIHRALDRAQRAAVSSIDHASERWVMPTLPAPAPTPPAANPAPAPAPTPRVDTGRHSRRHRQTRASNDPCEGLVGSFARLNGCGG